MSLWLLLLSFGILTLGRVLLLALHHQDFADLDGGQLARAFLQGLRFDASILATLFWLPFVALNIPWRRLHRRAWVLPWAWLLFVALIAGSLLLVGDVVYYGYVGRHAGNELFLMVEDMGFLAQMAFGPYLWATALWALVCLAGAWLWWRYLRRPMRPTRRPLLVFCILVVACLAAARGTFSRKAMTTADAYGKGYAAGNLALNGLYTIWHAEAPVDAADHEHMAESEALRVLGLPEKRYPLIRSLEGVQPTGKNIVIFLLESFDLKYVGSFGGRKDLTPNFDRLAAGGVRFRNMYSPSVRSIESIQAMLLGVPTIPGLPELGRGLELCQLTQLGRIAREHGYNTYFLQSSKRRSYYLDASAEMMGFEHYYGQQDVSEHSHYPGRPVPQWGWDHDTMQFARDRVVENGAPFLLFLFTGSTHTPYPLAGPEFEMEPHEERGPGGLVNTIHYTDWAIGKFIEGIRDQPWFDDTIFILTADHPWRKGVGQDMRDEFRIPFVIHAPGVLEPRDEYGTSSLLDVLPTLMDLLGFDEPFSAMGSSLLRPHEGHAWVQRGTVVGMISDEGFVLHSLKRLLESGGGPAGSSPEVRNRLVQRLLATDQLGFDLVRSNRWFSRSPSE